MISFAELAEVEKIIRSVNDKAVLPRFRSLNDSDIAMKGPMDPVTVADREAEDLLREQLTALLPGSVVVGEEAVSEDASVLDSLTGSAPVWIVDPIDGTRAFIMGQPLWGTLIGLTCDGAPLLGLMDQPFTGERFFSDERAAFLRHGGTTKQIQSRKGMALEDALLACTSPDLFQTGSERDRFEALNRAVRLRRFGGDCYNYCLLALGLVDLVVESGLKAFDIVPLIPIIERAGGAVTTWDGGDPRNGGRILAAGDPKLHASAVEMLSR